MNPHILYLILRGKTNENPRDLFHIRESVQFLFGSYIGTVTNTIIVSLSNFNVCCEVNIFVEQDDGESKCRLQASIHIVRWPGVLSSLASLRNVPSSNLGQIELLDLKIENRDQIWKYKPKRECE